MSDTFYEESISKKHWTYDPICSAPCTQCWQHDMTWLSYQHQQRGARKINELCLSCEGANVWLHTALQMSSRLKKQNILLHSWLLYHIMSWPFSIHNTHPSNLHQAFWPKLMHFPPQLFQNSSNTRMTKSPFVSTRQNAKDLATAPANLKQ